MSPGRGMEAARAAPAAQQENVATQPHRPVARLPLRPHIQHASQTHPTNTSRVFAAATNSPKLHPALTRPSAAARAVAIGPGPPPLPPPAAPLAGGPSSASCSWMARRRPAGSAPTFSATFCWSLRAHGAGANMAGGEGGTGAWHYSWLPSRPSVCNNTARTGIGFFLARSRHGTAWHLHSAARGWAASRVKGRGCWQGAPVEVEGWEASDGCGARQGLVGCRLLAIHLQGRQAASGGREQARPRAWPHGMAGERGSRSGHRPSRAGPGGAPPTLTTASRPRCSPASCCSTGSIMRQGPHQEAEKSTSTSCGARGGGGEGGCLARFQGSVDTFGDGWHTAGVQRRGTRAPCGAASAANGQERLLQGAKTLVSAAVTKQQGMLQPGLLAYNELGAHSLLAHRPRRTWCLRAAAASMLLSSLLPWLRACTPPSA